MAASSSSSCNWVYDVFPSFSGEDVRVTFLSHFLKELDRKLITAFKDNEMERSQSLDPELKQAIRTSRIAVVLLSEKYPSSSWCLNELVEIVKCNKASGQLIMPVFYGLDPSCVRKQTGKFGEAFAKTCLKKTKEETRIWRRSLNTVSNILGYHTQHWPNEAEMIEVIANDILSKLNLNPPKDFEDFVGMEDHIANMSLLLHLESKEVRMVGVWGSSGIGKTSIARALYSQLSRQFQSTVFIDKAFVSKSMRIYQNANPDDYNMKLHLVRSFLSEILHKKDIRISCLGAVEEMLKRKKVLIVIDDLDHQVVLNTLVGKSEWFGHGSRIIVITNDKQFLRAHGIEHIYEVFLPSDKRALKMLCRFAFRKNSPPDGLMEFASEAALCAGNLPLGLHVLGSYIRGKEKEDLMEMLPRLRNDLDGDIKKTLRVSYDGLNSPKDKSIFRHIACLFNGEEVSHIELLLADSDLDVRIGLKNLADKSLIHIDGSNVVMHSLLQKMGKDIVRTQSNKPGEREFVVDSKDICALLEDNTGSDKVLGIALDMDEIDELHIHESAFNGMSNMLFLNIYTKEWYQKRLTTKKWDKEKGARWHLSEGFNNLPKKLRLLKLDGYPMRYLPSSFRPENLVKLQMQESKLERLWEGIHQTLRSLRKIDLQNSIHLKEIPDLSMATNLETLELSNCSCLVELPSSIGYLNKLRKLYMSGCTSLETFPNGINLQSLYSVSLHDCPRLKSFPDISTNITLLSLSQNSIDECHSDLSLENLGMNRTPETLVKLRKPFLAMSGLTLSNIPSLVELPFSIHNYSRLETLYIIECTNLETLPTGINFCFLRILNLSGCSRLRTFPNISTNIEKLYLEGTGIEEVPWWIEYFTKLTSIYMKSSNNLVRVSSNIYKLKLLRVALFPDCKALTEASWNGSSSGVAMATEMSLFHERSIPTNQLYLSDCKALNEGSWNGSSSGVEMATEMSLFHDRSIPTNELYLSVMNSLNLDPEALLHNRSVIFNSMAISGEEVPSYFTHQTTGYSLTNIPLLPTSLSREFFKFRAGAVADFDSMPINVSNAVDIHVSCHFRDRCGNRLDSFGEIYNFWAAQMGCYLFILDCRIRLNEDNASLAQLNYDQVDMQIHIEKRLTHFRKIGPTFKLKGWGIRLLEECI